MSRLSPRVLSKLHHLTDQIDQLRSELEPTASDERILSAVRRWLDSLAKRGRKTSTLGSYEWALRVLVAAVGNKQLCQLTPFDIEDALALISDRSQSAIYSAWSSFFGWAGMRWLLPDVRPRSKRREAYLDADHLRHWIAALGVATDQRWARRRTLDCILLGTLVPLRRGEIVSLRWHEVDVGLRVACLEDSKTGPRWAPLGRLGASIIASQPRTGDYVFAPPRRTETPHITGSSISHAFIRITRRYAELTGHRWPKGLCFHSLRHTWASLALVSGEPVEIVRRVMGHSSVHMLERYSHVLGVQLGETTDRVQGRLVADLQLQLSIATS